VHERQYADMMPLQAVERVLGWTLWLATALFLARFWRRQIGRKPSYQGDNGFFAFNAGSVYFFATRQA